MHLKSLREREREEMKYHGHKKVGTFGNYFKTDSQDHTQTYSKIKRVQYIIILFDPKVAFKL